MVARIDDRTTAHNAIRADRCPPMTTYKHVNYTEIEPVSGAMHQLREHLESDRVGVTVAPCEPGWKSQPHDHRRNGHEEIYVLIEGEATVVVENEPVAMESGDAIRIPPSATRQIRNGDVRSTFVLVSAPECHRPIEDGRSDSWVLEGFQG